MSHRENCIYLCAPINALVEGIYEEKIPFTEIKKHGDFGLGTFDDLDGEMIMLDGQVYQIGADGSVKKVSDEALTPFACVTFYQPLSHDDAPERMPYPKFLEWLYSLLPSPNLFYAIRVEGKFVHIKVRSVPKQENYRPLVEVTKNQPVFELENIEGTLAGFYTPGFMPALSVPGLHLHLLSADRQHGGHLLECSTENVRVGVQILDRVEVALPKTLDYLTWDFQRDIARDLSRAEK
jgi:acetolactate decarboxylase